MKSASAAKIAARFDEYLGASRKEPMLITRNRKPVALLLAVEDKAEAQRLAVRGFLSLRSVFEAAHAGLESGRAIPHDQFWREVKE